MCKLPHETNSATVRLAKMVSFSGRGISWFHQGFDSFTGPDHLTGYAESGILVVHENLLRDYERVGAPGGVCKHRRVQILQRVGRIHPLRYNFIGF